MPGDPGCRAAHRPRDAAGDAPRPARHRPKTPVVPAGRAPRFFCGPTAWGQSPPAPSSPLPGIRAGSGPHGVSARPRAGGRQGGRQRSGCVGWRRWRGRGRRKRPAPCRKRPNRSRPAAPPRPARPGETNGALEKTARLEPISARNLGLSGSFVKRFVAQSCSAAFALRRTTAQDYSVNSAAAVVPSALANLATMTMVGLRAPRSTPDTYVRSTSAKSASASCEIPAL